jgi:hypothetical protein
VSAQPLQGTVAGRDGTTLPVGSVPVTVIIAARNEAGDIGDCVRSVSWAREVLVVENDSTDDTTTGARQARRSSGTRSRRRAAECRDRARDAAMDLVVDADGAARRPSAPRSRAGDVSASCIQRGAPCLPRAPAQLLFRARDKARRVGA